MTAAAIVVDLGRLDIRLRAEGEWLDCDAPHGVLTDEVIETLRSHKAELLRYLAPPEHGIVIETPDRARMMAAVASLPEGPGDADETGLEHEARWIDSPTEFHPIDLTAPDCPAWVFDDSLTVRPSDLRSALEANSRMGG